MVDDEKKPEKITALNQYLQDQFPDLEVRYHHNFDHMAEVFTIIKGPSTNFLRLMVGEDYIDDHTDFGCQAQRFNDSFSSPRRAESNSTVR